MTESTDLVTWSDERAERVLDAATELLVRWGYQRVTIDEVARLAGVGKGTVYLHFRGKDSLFLTVLLRAHRRTLGTIADRMIADPAQVLPSRMTRSVYLDLAGDPATRALYLGDAEILGRLAHEGASTLGGLAERRVEVGRAQFELLRAAGCLQPSPGIDAQLHMFSAITAGFFFVDALPGAPADPGERADLLERALAAALQVAEPPAAALAGVAPEIAAHYRTLITHIDHEWRKRVR